LLRADPRFEPTLGSKDVLYRLPLTEGAEMTRTAVPPPRRAAGASRDSLRCASVAPRRTAGASRDSLRCASVAEVAVRALDASDFQQWERLNSAYCAELKLPLPVVDDAHAVEFARRTRAKWWWGAFVGRQLAAIVGLNAAYGTVGQVGGVYARPEDRKKGLARAAMELLIEDSREHHRFTKLILFTGEENLGARRLYESLGFELAGAFGLLLGSRRPQPQPKRSGGNPAKHLGRDEGQPKRSGGNPAKHLGRDEGQPKRSGGNPAKHLRGDEGRAQPRYKWEGQSGERYTYEVHAWPLRLSPGPGNFIFANSLGAGHWRPLQIGECADLAALADQERLRNSAGRQVPSHVHVRVNFNPSAVRRREVSDLAARWMTDHD
jgi:ribosomal protein S18 acetylase RimI-like enzyme